MENQVSVESKTRKLRNAKRGRVSEGWNQRIPSPPFPQRANVWSPTKVVTKY